MQEKKKRVARVGDESVAGCLPLPIGAVKHRSSTAVIEADPRQTLMGNWGKG